MSRLHLCSLLAIFLNFTFALINNETLNEPNDIVLQFHSNDTIHEKIVELGENSVVRIFSVDVPNYAQFSVVQAHSQFQQITLGREEVVETGNHVNGTSVGILVDFSLNRTGVMAYLFNPHPFNVTVMVFMVTYDRTFPVPGGCNSEFEMKESPWLRMSYNQNIVSVEHQLASLPPRKASGCESDSLRYDVYHYYLTQRDFTQESFFEAIRLFRTVKGAQENGREIRLFGFTPTTRSTFSLYPGVGRVFAVTVTYVGDSSHFPVSAYVPTFTYGCDLDKEGDCQTLSTIYGKILCALSLFIGLFVAFAGHRYFQIEMFLAGFAAFSAVSYIVLVNHFDSDVTGLAAGTSVMGLLGGLFWWFVWSYWGIPALSVLPVVLMLGFLMSSILFYLPISFEFLVKDFNFWSAFACCWLVLPVAFLTFTRLGNIVSCAVLGSYAVIVPIDHYVGSSLKYILLNVVRRATVHGFGRAVLDPPYQDNDLILTLAWITLALSGAAFQYLREGKRPPFSPPGEVWRPWSWRRDTTTQPLSEREPLISDSTATGRDYGSA